jgi:hypothetical protein
VTTRLTLDGAAAGFGQAACVVVLFSTALAWVEDAVEPVEHAMASLTGNHWVSHGLTDVVLFVALGLILARRRAAADGAALARRVAGAAVAAAIGLVFWFALV